MITLPFATMYLIAYATALTVIVGLVVYAMAKRKEQDGTPFNMGLLQFGGGVTTVLWLLAAGTYVMQA